MEHTDKLETESDLAVGTISLIIGSFVIYHDYQRSPQMRCLYWQILGFFTIFIVCSIYRLYYNFNEETDGKIPEDASYAVWSILYLLEKSIFLLINWQFAFKYWIVSLTLRQALSDNQTSFSEKNQWRLFLGLIAFCQLLVLADSFIYYYGRVSKDSEVLRISDSTYIVYGFSQLLSWSFLLIAICRISSLLRKFQELKLNTVHMVMHALLQVVNITL